MDCIADIIWGLSFDFVVNRERSRTAQDNNRFGLAEQSLINVTRDYYIAAFFYRHRTFL